LNSRDKFLAVMNSRSNSVANKWEFGYWGSTVKRWYKEGLPQKMYPKLPKNIINTNASLYTAMWTYQWQKNKNLFEKIYNEPESQIVLSDGLAVMAGGLPWPNQGFPLDYDIKEYFNLDKTQVLVCAEQLLYPLFDIEILYEDERYIDYKDIDGGTRRFSKIQQVIPSGLDYIIKDENDWEVIKRERMSLDNIRQRLPKNWNELVKEYKNRDYPLSVGGYPAGIFGSLTHMIGYENLFLFYYDKPNLLKDMLDRITDIWIALWEEILQDVDFDLANIWEDISSGKGSMVSPSVFKEFIAPYYKKISSFLKSKGIKILLVDTDGDCSELIPLFMKAGVTGLYPMEVSAGMNVVEARKKYPDLQILGGIPKLDIKYGKQKIDEILEPVKWLLKQGKYIPFCDHFVPPEVSWKNFEYYRFKLNSIINKS
jgi:hypothetical protein